jgi:hypothetical protein
MLAAVCAIPLMAAVRSVVVPSSAQLLILSPNESNEVTLLFALGVAAGAGLAAAVVCYGRPLSPTARWTVVLVPLLCVAVADAALKALQLRYAVDWATRNGIPPSFPLKAVGLHTIPWAGVAAGLLVAGVALWRLRSSRLLGTPLGGSLMQSDDDLSRLSGGDSLVRGTIDPLRMSAYSSAAVSEVPSDLPRSPP